ncbi:metalloregulator ArsR/SmtB family transcription factor [soil metagenome]
MQTLAALADPTRLRIVELLAEKERSSGDLVKQFRISAPAISQHLKVLHQARLVSVRVEGQKRIQMLDPRGLEELDAWLSRTKRVWTARLDTLERLLLAEDSNPKPKKK